MLVADGKIQELGAGVVSDLPGLQTVDLEGFFVFPGLIDAHVHATAVMRNLRESANLPSSYVSAGATHILRGMVRRGFTTVRDMGGADWGLAAAARDGMAGTLPDLIFCGRALSQTGGHGDLRGRSGGTDPCCSIGEVCDGPEDVRRTVRQQIASGADHIKLMLGGGVSTELDGMDNMQFSDEEVRVAVAEAAAADRYVAGHAYTPAAITRAVRLGVRSIEHGNLLDDDAAQLMAAQNVYLVPTLVTYEDLADEARVGQVPSYVVDKVAAVRSAGLTAIERARRAGVSIAFGTDLLGAGHRRQLEEFRLRAEVETPLQTLQSATITSAELLNRRGQIGIVAEGARADLVIAGLDPTTQSIDELSNHPYTVMVRGRFTAPVPRPVSV